MNMDQKHLDLINKILDLPVISELTQGELIIKYNLNIRWEIQYTYFFPSGEQKYTYNTEFYQENEMGNDGLSYILEQLLDQLKKINTLNKK